MPDFDHGIFSAMIVVLFALLFAWGGFFLRHLIERIVDRIRPDEPGRPERPGRPDKP